MRNNGAAAWPVGTTLLFVGGFAANTPVRLLDSFDVATAGVGEEVELSVELKAPEMEGRYMYVCRRRACADRQELLAPRDC